MNTIYVLLGKSAVGKDTLFQLLKNELDLNTITSHSTRPMRENEEEGNPYYFIDKETMNNYIINDELIEYRKYNTILNGIEDVWYYAVHKDEVKNNTSYIVILDKMGLIEFKNKFKDRIKSFYISVDDEERTKRAKSRGSFDDVEWNRRLQTDEKDFEDIEQHVTHIIHNEDLHNCFNEIKNIIRRDKTINELKNIKTSTWGEQIILSKCLEMIKEMK